MGAKPASGKPGPAGDKVTAAYQDLLQEIAQKKKASVEAAKRGPKKRKGTVVRAVLAVILPPLVAAVWIFKPFAPPPVTVTRQPEDVGVWQTTLLAAARRVADWRDSAGYLPLQLEATGVTLTGVTYDVTDDSSFVLRSFVDDRAVAVFVDGHLYGVDAPPRRAPPPPPPEYLP